VLSTCTNRCSGIPLLGEPLPHHYISPDRPRRFRLDRRSWIAWHVTFRGSWRAKRRLLFNQSIATSTCVVSKSIGTHTHHFTHHTWSLHVIHTRTVRTWFGRGNDDNYNSIYRRYLPFADVDERLPRRHTDSYRYLPTSNRHQSTSYLLTLTISRAIDTRQLAVTLFIYPH
jgi:hypothetical protein